ncbi:SDR family oxidoreductase [Nocardioides carbamazepini]|uniref:SDR family NAD(P)-dependent oxidoreductase n=1 Tax=Nocardioides carbamazepini TaxID=2854259 RepID=UPI00214A87B6|nr:SDR family NAD(P)-dependent oxidoreductase [Nocardioides carbamazepini]MCR1784116.1 SDR family oxidoreductase [Nocardioides carbamazepini]
MRQLDQRRVVVTGALGGIGTAVTARLLADGAQVLAVDHPDVVRRDRGPSSPGLHVVGVDLRDPHASTEVARQGLERLGGVDALVNNAGIELRAPLADHLDERWDAVFDINLRAPFRLARDLADLLAAGRSPAVVNVCSIAVTGFAGQVAYDASKGGLLTLTRSLAVELGPRGVRANAICPGFIDTPMLDEGELRALAERVARTLPLRRLGRPADVAGAVSWLLGDDAGYVTGQSLFIDGGMNRQ